MSGIGVLHDDLVLTGETVRVLIADDHELFRDGLRLVLNELGPDVEVVEASCYEEILSRIDNGPVVDVLLLDLVMPGRTWTDVLRSLKERAPSLPVVILSASEDRRLVLEAVRLGAAGFIPKTSSSRVMLSALRLVLSGGVYLPPTLIDEPSPMSAHAQDPTAALAGLSHHGVPLASTAEHGDVSPLTPRQREVLALLGQGKSNKEIARILDLSEGTVKLHVTAILKALNVSNRTGAVVAASRLGLANLNG
ncbi:two component transcriptional regulator, LuxR family [Insolitispirillum peregrinum]|uniref:Two component transcriptional regulator, LuxR family n=1 Tax=Insolitispirillum peregrinum TaxID=80876 RepID=A0A1N7MDV4_9PROT|nr:two component transcriptional regulator, LuxR family [Insolitispirillum peregrinum]